MKLAGHILRSNNSDPLRRVSYERHSAVNYNVGKKWRVPGNSGYCILVGMPRKKLKEERSKILRKKLQSVGTSKKPSILSIAVASPRFHLMCHETGTEPWQLNKNWQGVPIPFQSQEQTKPVFRIPVPPCEISWTSRKRFTVIGLHSCRIIELYQWCKPANQDFIVLRPFESIWRRKIVTGTCSTASPKHYPSWEVTRLPSWEVPTQSNPHLHGEINESQRDEKQS